MKEMTLLFAGLCLTGLLQAQEPITDGRVVYRETQKLEIRLEGDAAQFAHALPKERSSRKVLLFNEDAAVYKNAKEGGDAEDLAMEQGGAMVQIKMVEPDNQFFTNLKDQSTVEQREFMTRLFLIQGEQESGGWKISGEQKEIIGYPCQMATRMGTDSTLVEAWFCAEIPVSAGPQNFSGLPGLVLEVNINEGERTIIAETLEPLSAEEELIKPKKGKKVSREEFDQIVKEKMEEMGAQSGARQGTFIMHIER